MKKIITSLFVFLLFHISPVFAELAINPNNPLNLSSSYTLNTDYESYGVLENGKITGFAVYRDYNGRLNLFYKGPTHSTVYQEEGSMNFYYDNGNCSSYSGNSRYRCLSKQYYGEILDARIVGEDLIVDMENSLMRCYMYSFWQYGTVWTANCTAIGYKEGARSIYGSTLTIMTDYKWLKLTNTASAGAIVLKISKSDGTESYFYLNKTYKISSFTPDNSAVFEEIDYDFQKVKWNGESYTFEGVVKKYEECKIANFSEIVEIDPLINVPTTKQTHTTLERETNGTNSYIAKYHGYYGDNQTKTFELSLNKADNIDLVEWDNFINGQADKIIFDKTITNGTVQPYLQIQGNVVNLTFTGGIARVDPRCAGWYSELNPEITSGKVYESKSGDNICVAFDVGLFGNLEISKISGGFAKKSIKEKKVCRNKIGQVFVNDILKEGKLFGDYSEKGINSDNDSIENKEPDNSLAKINNKFDFEVKPEKGPINDKIEKMVMDNTPIRDYIQFWDFTLPDEPNITLELPKPKLNKYGVPSFSGSIKAELVPIEDKLGIITDKRDVGGLAFISLILSIVYLFLRLCLIFILFSIFILFYKFIEFLSGVFTGFGGKSHTGNIWSMVTFVLFWLSFVGVMVVISGYMVASLGVFDAVADKLTFIFSVLSVNIGNYDMFKNIINSFTYGITGSTLLYIAHLLFSKYGKIN